MLEIVSAAGLSSHCDLAGRLQTQGHRLVPDLEHFNLCVEESPVPESEWNRLTEVLGLELLPRLLGISATSVRRYKAAARTTPDDVADRLHYLSLIVGDLSGAYNEIGIRQWFEQKRAQLDGHTPLDHLKAPRVKIAERGEQAQCEVERRGPDEIAHVCHRCVHRIGAFTALRTVVYAFAPIGNRPFDRPA